MHHLVWGVTEIVPVKKIDFKNLVQCDNQIQYLKGSPHRRVSDCLSNAEHKSDNDYI